MKEADYAVTKGDKLQRALSLLLMLAVIGFQISDGSLLIWYRFAAAPVLATSMIWFSDSFGTSLSWRTAARDIRLMGWIGLLLIAGIVFLL